MKHLSHIGQLKRFSPVCVRVWRVSSSDRENFLPQLGQVHSNGRSPEEINTCYICIIHFKSLSGISDIHMLCNTRLVLTENRFLFKHRSYAVSHCSQINCSESKSRSILFLRFLENRFVLTIASRNKPTVDLKMLSQDNKRTKNNKHSPFCSLLLQPLHVRQWTSYLSALVYNRGERSAGGDVWGNSGAGGLCSDKYMWEQQCRSNLMWITSQYVSLTFWLATHV